MATNKEVYVVKDSNSSEITAGSIYVLDFQEIAEKSDYLPHNKLRIFNKSAVEVQVFLDNYGDGTKPDYIISAGNGIDESVLEGVQFNLVVFKNTDGATSINADELKTRIATVRNVL